MQAVWLYTLSSVLGVSVISVIGIVVVLINKKRLDSILTLLISFSAGALLGGAMLHLLPEAIEKDGFSLSITGYVLCGMIIFFILEKIVHWRHCHHISCEGHPHHLGVMNLVGDAVHNAIDGAVIAGSFMASPELGITTTLAVILHEIPQEIGDFGVLLYAGYKPKKAVMYNLLSASFAIVGAVAALLLGSQITHFTEIIIPLTAGGFIYIASADLIPELHKEVKVSKSIAQLAMILVGIGLMAILATGHSDSQVDNDTAQPIYETGDLVL
ncbi:ZIP family metal transporter [Candidatus Peregrinibacteria bacterium CG22_combo_CG10-13_8_21_14_all_44_10]|nr:MAG: hypothetical protein AUK45_00380 [Candidatus Peregrinibacteria bacterium CG2_30_44_17]PIP66228.1 MAG: ZIP family metal transporter [Candidatus Peregrinibacteria bacterium CG22_combo_CG10-13_8_21_14_all_44_10]PIX79651.1 MAG: ZIP family metal transporter [Candidatus Peregrinibacteria bacterium CG_4_10_14_3_um_filter_44_21]PJB89280.1 MAG: ZIP family metal transporter [Candidatus Peregrinibacteria bacterium CG_4_9_14_0_8_um_filter_44_15]